MRFSDNVNPTVRFGAVICPTVDFGAVLEIRNPTMRFGAGLKNKKSHGVVRCGFHKSYGIPYDVVFRDQESHGACYIRLFIYHTVNPTVRFDAVTYPTMRFGAVPR